MRVENLLSIPLFIYRNDMENLGEKRKMLDIYFQEVKEKTQLALKRSPRQTTGNKVIFKAGLKYPACILDEIHDWRRLF